MHCNVQTLIVNDGASRGDDVTVDWADLVRSDDTGDCRQLPTFSSLGIKSTDPVILFFSSGTTGPQKAVALSNRNLHAQLAISRFTADALQSLYSRMCLFANNSKEKVYNVKVVGRRQAKCNHINECLSHLQNKDTCIHVVRYTIPFQTNTQYTTALI